MNANVPSLFNELKLATKNMNNILTHIMIALDFSMDAYSKRNLWF